MPLSQRGGKWILPTFRGGWSDFNRSIAVTEGTLLKKDRDQRFFASLKNDDEG
jgi:hypothetical protein